MSEAWPELALDDWVDTRALALRERSVSDFYAAFLQALDELDIAVALNPLPSELADPTPFPQDSARSAYDASAIGRWWQVMLSVERVIQRFRTGYTGKSSPVLFYWGGFDLNHTRFNGRPAPCPRTPTRSAASERTRRTSRWASGRGRETRPSR